MSSKKTKGRRRTALSAVASPATGKLPDTRASVFTRKTSLVWPAIIILILSFILYGSSIWYGYVLDDEIVISRNAYVQKGLQGLPDIFGHDTFMGYFQNKQDLFLLQGGRYRPLSLATFAMEITVFGPDRPEVSHFINILLYAFTGIVLFLVLMKMGLFARPAMLLPLLAAVLWILHPIHTEAVANIKGRDEILTLLGSLLALMASLNYIASKKNYWLWLSGFFLFLGLLAKENALTFLAVIPLSLWFFKKIPARKLLTVSIPLLAASILFMIIRYEALGYFLEHGHRVNNLMNDSFLGMSFAEKYATILYTLGWYLKLLVVPHPLTHDYYPYHVPIMHWGNFAVIFSLGIYLVMTLWAVLRISTRNVYAYCILFFIITLSIVSNLIVSVGSFMNERFLFTPSVAFCLATSWFLVKTLPTLFDNRLNYKKTAISIITVIIVFYGWRTLIRVPDWSDQMILDRSAYRVSKNSARANCFYAVSLYTRRYLTTKDAAEQARIVDTMEFCINKAISIYPDYEAAWQMKSGIVAARFNIDHNIDSLFYHFRHILEKIPGNVSSRDFINKYIKYVYPTWPRQTIDFCYQAGYDLFYRKKNDYKNAIAFLELGLQEEPGNHELRNALATVYEAMGNKTKADELRH